MVANDQSRNRFPQPLGSSRRLLPRCGRMAGGLERPHAQPVPAPPHRRAHPGAAFATNAFHSASRSPGARCRIGPAALISSPARRDGVIALAGKGVGLRGVASIFRPAGMVPGATAPAPGGDEVSVGVPAKPQGEIFLRIIQIEGGIRSRFWRAAVRDCHTVGGPDEAPARGSTASAQRHRLRVVTDVQAFLHKAKWLDRSRTAIRADAQSISAHRLAARVTQDIRL
jgi:hypothetical protein